MSRSTLHLLLLAAVLPLSLASCRRSAPPPATGGPARSMYATCNLKVLKGNQVTWVNWQASPTHIPVGTPLKVSGGPQTWHLTNEAGTVYTLDAGAAGEQYLSKFVSAGRKRLEDFPEPARANITKGVARVGMTKEQVYAAMGPPANVDTVNSNQMTREQIMAGLLWVYRRRTFGKNIGVRFDASGAVTDTEGIWK